MAVPVVSVEGPGGSEPFEHPSIRGSNPNMWDIVLN